MILTVCVLPLDTHSLFVSSLSLALSFFFLLLPPRLDFAPAGEYLWRMILTVCVLPLTQAILPFYTNWKWFVSFFFLSFAINDEHVVHQVRVSPFTSVCSCGSSLVLGSPGCELVEGVEGKRDGWSRRYTTQERSSTKSSSRRFSMVHFVFRDDFSWGGARQRDETKDETESTSEDGSIITSNRLQSLRCGKWQVGNTVSFFSLCSFRIDGWMDCSSVSVSVFSAVKCVILTRSIGSTSVPGSASISVCTVKESMRMGEKTMNRMTPPKCKRRTCSLSISSLRFLCFIFSITSFHSLPFLV